MTVKDLGEATRVLKLVPFFSGLSDRELAPLAVHSLRRQYRRNQVIFHQGDPGTTLYVVLSGKIRIVLPSPDGEDMVLAVFSPGDCFGELSLLDGEPRSATAIAQEACEVLILARSEFLAHLGAHPDVAVRVSQTIAARLRRTNVLLGDFAFLDLSARLAKRLLELACAQGERTGARAPMKIQITQGELASLVGARRESVNKELRAFARRGMLTIERGHVLIRNPEGLAQVVA